MRERERERGRGRGGREKKDGFLEQTEVEIK